MQHRVSPLSSKQFFTATMYVERPSSVGPACPAELIRAQQPRTPYCACTLSEGDALMLRSIPKRLQHSHQAGYFACSFK